MTALVLLILVLSAVDTALALAGAARHRCLARYAEAYWRVR